MPIVETFVAVDEDGNTHKVDVNEVPFPRLTGRRAVRDFSLTDTGEILRQDAQQPELFVGISTGVRLTRTR